MALVVAAGSALDYAMLEQFRRRHPGEKAPVVMPTLVVTNAASVQAWRKELTAYAGLVVHVHRCVGARVCVGDTMRAWKHRAWPRRLPLRIRMVCATLLAQRWQGAPVA